MFHYSLTLIVSFQVHKCSPCDLWFPNTSKQKLIVASNEKTKLFWRTMNTNVLYLAGYHSMPGKADILYEKNWPTMTWNQVRNFAIFYVQKWPFILRCCFQPDTIHLYSWFFKRVWFSHC
jgi:hypothetical protein